MRSDAILMEILQERRTINGFLDAVFGFLQRNTDFYIIKNNKENVGFPKGMRQQIVYDAMQCYDPEHTPNKLVTDDNDAGVPPAIEEVEIETVNDLKDQENSLHELHLKQKPTVDVREKLTFTSNDYKNGNCFNNYCWSQTIKDIDLQIILPDKLKDSRAISLSIQAKNIKVFNKLQPSEIVLEGELSHKCKHNDAVWTLSEGKLLISIDKVKEIWWDRFFINEPEIDAKKIDCEQFIDELPEESQVAIEKIRIDQLKQNQTPVTPASKLESDTMEKLRKAWDVEGSPFRGQPFDPSLVKLN